jgi:anti-sigma regulatory factor (Ser/Thr protein kinase)
VIHVGIAVETRCARSNPHSGVLVPLPSWRYDWVIEQINPAYTKEARHRIESELDDSSDGSYAVAADCPTSDTVGLADSMSSLRMPTKREIPWPRPSRRIPFMALIDLAGRVDPTVVLRGLIRARTRGAELEQVTFRFTHGANPTPGALALLAAWLLANREEGGDPQITGDSRVIEPLARIDPQRLLRLGAPAGRPYPNAASVPLTTISNGRQVNDAVNALCEIVVRHAPDPRGVLPAIEWAVNEVTDNVELHASAATPGIFCARLDPGPNRLEVAVVDQGIGIRASLGSAIPAGSDGEAIAKALQRGVTRDPSVGQGNGLAGTKEIILQNGGDLMLWSGVAMFRIGDGQDKGYIPVSGSAGTGVVLSFHLNQPIDLRRTFIAGTALDYIERQAEAVAEHGLLVREQVSSTRSRGPAKQLRQKVLAMMPDIDGGVRLDFTGVEIAASSFLDELLGRLAASLGEEAFRRRIQLQNMTPLVGQIANVVISQRLRGLEPEITDETDED